MSNAAKHRKKAAEFEQLKQIDRAIASYVKAIEESEAAGEDVDVALYNKVGDLALRQGRVPDAITYYERAVEHYATSGLFNNAIALCNKILRNAPGRANVYFTLGRISARKGLRGDATRNFLEYATRMQQDGRIEEGIRALAEVLDIMPELSDVRTMVEDLATRAGIALPRRRTPMRTDRVPTPVSSPSVRDQKSADLVFLDIDYGDATRRTPAYGSRRATPATAPVVAPLEDLEATSAATGTNTPATAPVVDLPFLDTSERLPDLAPTAEMVEEAIPLDTGMAGSPPLEGLEANGEFDLADAALPTLEGFTPDEPVGEPAPLSALEPAEFSDVTHDPGAVRDIATDTPVIPTAIEVEEPVLGHAADGELVIEVEEPVLGPAADGELVIEALTLDEFAPRESGELDIVPLVVEPVPELDAAIAAGRELVELAEAERRDASPPGALSPVSVTPVSVTPVSVTPVSVTPVTLTPVSLTPVLLTPVSLTPVLPVEAILPEVAPPLVELDDVVEQLEPTRPPFRLDPHDFILPGELPPLVLDAAVLDTVASQSDAASVVHLEVPVPPELPPAPDAGAVEIEAAREEAVTSTHRSPVAPEAVAPPDTVAVGVTPSLPIAAVAEVATSVASSRRDALRAAVARLPRNWLLRRRLAEALFEAGERDAALDELETAQQGLVNDGEFGAACDIADELVQVSPDRVAYHQKRVELAVRSSDQQRLRVAYLDLADALVRQGEEGRARAVYARVLEIDPYDDRARAALGAAAPPPPPSVSPDRDDDRFVDLADWLRDDDLPPDTRMRMREPAISGDEQADFDALLRHFKEGVSRSLGEDDFESHYDLGVAYKEMGLLDDAIAEFQKALRSRTHRLPAYEALGQCFVEQGRFQVAATVLSRALHEPGLHDDQRVGVLYLLAYSCEALQRKDEARSYFQRVYATDINFRDVAARLAALEQASR